MSLFAEVMKADNPKLQAALVKAGLADELEVRHDYKGALDLYKDAVGILIPLIEGKSTYVTVSVKRGHSASKNSFPINGTHR